MSFEKDFTKSANSAAIPLIDAVFRWCEFLRGNLAVDSAVKVLALSVGADAVALSRVRHDETSSSRSICFDKLEAASNAPRLKRSYAAPLLGRFLPSARPGTLWLKSLVEIEADPELDHFHVRRKFREMAIIPLATGARHSDFLELHFSSRLSPDQHAVLSSLGVTLGEGWAGRASGIFTANAVKGDVLPEPDTLDDAPILGFDNPARLSRAEYRVCLLFSKGMSSRAVCSELSISAATLRTHLRNIHAKTNTENLVDLVFVLLKGGAHSGLPERKIA